MMKHLLVWIYRND